jgi:hypothetical protein
MQRPTLQIRRQIHQQMHKESRRPQPGSLQSHRHLDLKHQKVPVGLGFRIGPIRMFLRWSNTRWVRVVCLCVS